MQTEINYDEVYHKIYHHTSNMLVHYLVKWTRIIGNRCRHDLVIKDETVKQVTLNVTNMDKINIVSSQAVLEMSFFNMDTRLMSSSPLANSLVKNRLFKTTLDIDEPPFQFFHTMDLSVVDTMLHDSPDLVIHRTKIWAVLRPQIGGKKVWRFLTQQFNCCTCPGRCVGALSCWNNYETLCVWLAAVWRHYDVVKQRWRSQQEISPEFPAF